MKLATLNSSVAHCHFGSARSHSFRPTAGVRHIAKPCRHLSTVVYSAASTQERATVKDAGALPVGLSDSVWEPKKYSQQRFPKLTEDVSADVVIVGGGISGLSIAYNLVQAGKSVVVLDSKTRGSGQTGRTTAHLMLWNDDYYSELISVYGLSKATLVADSHVKAIEWVEQTVQREGIDCKFTRLDGILFPHDSSPKTLETLDQELEAAHRVGLQGVEKVDLQGEAAGGSIRTALKFPGSAEFHVLQYLDGLADAITAKGGKIYEGTKVTHISGNKVETQDGHNVKAHATVMATNSPINHSLAIHARQAPDRSYVVGLRMPKGAFKRASYWDTASPYHYVRSEEVDGYEVLVVGGEDHKTGQDPADYEDSYAKLEAWARQRWSDAGERVFQWTGQVMEPSDLLGLYGREPLNDGNLGGHLYVATGDSGQGMTGGTIAGMLISDLILGRSNPWEHVYSPSRVPVRDGSSAMEAATQAKDTVQKLAESVLPRVKARKDIVKGDGAIVQHGLDKVAVYRDDTGVEHAFNAVCPHLGCLLEWNPNEKSFDCPCHGSHFDKQGKCINGPAKADLTPRDI